MQNPARRVVLLLGLAGCSAVLGLDDLSYTDTGEGGVGNAGATAGAGASGGGAAGAMGGTGAAPGGGGSGGVGGFGAVGGSPGCLLSDEFDVEADLDCWIPGPEQAPGVSTWTPGVLEVETVALGGWYELDRGWGLFKEVDGNFAASIHVATSSIADPPNPPVNPFNVAGLLVRNGERGDDWVVMTLGFQGSPNDALGTLSKSTNDGNTNAPPPTFDSSGGEASGDLAICRVGTSYTVYRRLTAGWIEGVTYERGDLPQVLQVGIIVDAFSGVPDLHAEFDYLRFASTPPVTRADCLAEFD